jgi:hypothetical protein
VSEDVVELSLKSLISDFPKAEPAADRLGILLGELWRAD